MDIDMCYHEMVEGIMHDYLLRKFLSMFPFNCQIVWLYKMKIKQNLVEYAVKSFPEVFIVVTGKFDNTSALYIFQNSL